LLIISVLNKFYYDIQHPEKFHKKTFRFTERFVYKNINNTSLPPLNNDVNYRNNI